MLIFGHILWQTWALFETFLFFWISIGEGGGGRERKEKGKWCVAKYGDPYLEFVLCI